MIQFYFHPAPNPAKIALFLEESGLPYELIPIETRKGEQHTAEFRRINPNGKVPVIVDTDDAGVQHSIFDSSAILLYLAEKSRKFLGSTTDRPDLLSWLFFISSGIGPYSGQAVHFQHAAPEKLPYAINRYRREVERHYQVLDARLAAREYIVGDGYTIVDMSAWGWIDRAAFILPGDGDALSPYPNLKRWFSLIDERPAAKRAREVGKSHTFKKEMDEEAMRSLFPSNYPKVS